MTKNIFSFLFLVVILLHAQPIWSQATEYNYSVKNRWKVKASISSYKTASFKQVHVQVGDNFFSSHPRKMVNFKLEANYGINKFIETGVFVGFQHYEYLKDTTNFSFISPNQSFAPLFGVNLNFHVLPFFVKSEKCKWDLYLTAKYGGCYLPNKESPFNDYPYSKYRQEYGLGLGVGYYFKNMIGLFAEGSVGQFFFFKKFNIAFASGSTLKFVDLTDSNFSFRIGIAAKF